MGYCVNYNFGEKLEHEDYENLSWDVFEDDDINLINTDHFNYFYNDYKDEDEEDEEEYKLSLIDDFKESQAYWELKETFFPMMNYIHILQHTPTGDRIDIVNKYADVCVVVSIEELDIQGLALTGGGMDLSDRLELAYYILDGVSPITSSDITMGKKSTKLLKHCREIAKKTGSISFNEICEFLKA